MIRGRLGERVETGTASTFRGSSGLTPDITVNQPCRGASCVKRILRSVCLVACVGETVKLRNRGWVWAFLGLGIFSPAPLTRFVFPLVLRLVGSNFLSSTLSPGFFVWSSRPPGRLPFGLAPLRPVWGLPEPSRKDQNMNPRTPLSRNELTLGASPTWDEQPWTVPKMCIMRLARSIFSYSPSVPDRRRIILLLYRSGSCFNTKLDQAHRVTHCYRRPLCAQGDLCTARLTRLPGAALRNIKSPHDPVFLAIGQFDADASGIAHWRSCSKRKLTLILQFRWSYFVPKIFIPVHGFYLNSLATPHNVHFDINCRDCEVHMPSLPSDAQPEPHLFGRPVLARPQTLPKAAKLAKLAKPQHAAAHRPWLGRLAVAPLPSQHNPFPWPQGPKQRNRLMMTTDLHALSLGEPRRGCQPALRL